MKFTEYYNDYRRAKMGAKGEKAAEESIDQKFFNKNFEFFKIVKRGKYELEGKKIKDKDAGKVYKAYRILSRNRMALRSDLKEETLMGSIMGRLGRFLEPLTKCAGFNWKVNIALISTFAAKENSVATIGAIYRPQEGESEESLEDRLKKGESGWTPLHALAIILFMAMYPPCIPTLLMIRLESGSTKWMLFAIIYPIALGFLIAVLVFTVGNLLGLSGLTAMISFYILALAVTTVMGFIKIKPQEE